MAKLKKNVDAKDVPLREYVETLIKIKQDIPKASTKAIFEVNQEHMKLYWSIGKIISEKQKSSKLDSELIERLAQDLPNNFPGMSCFSKANIRRMYSFFNSYAFLSQVVTQLEDLPIFHIPWGHNSVLLIKLKDTAQRLLYAQKSLEHGWSKSMLETSIESNLYEKQSEVETNFKKVAPPIQSDMAEQSRNDPYLFDFLTLHKKYLEKDLENNLINHVQNLLLGLKKGFGFIGKKYHLEVDEEDYYIDLLFYHTKLRCYVVVEVKARAFDPGDIGLLNFYLSVCDDRLRDASDNPTIGLLLCKEKNNVIIEYALNGFSSSIIVAEYETIMNELPQDLKSSLPTIEEIEAELERMEHLEKIKSKIRIAKFVTKIQ